MIGSETSNGPSPSTSEGRAPVGRDDDGEAPGVAVGVRHAGFRKAATGIIGAHNRSVAELPHPRGTSVQRDGLADDGEVLAPAATRLARRRTRREAGSPGCATAGTREPDWPGPRRIPSRSRRSTSATVTGPDRPMHTRPVSRHGAATSRNHDRKSRSPAGQPRTTLRHGSAVPNAVPCGDTVQGGSRRHSQPRHWATAVRVCRSTAARQQQAAGPRVSVAGVVAVHLHRRRRAVGWGGDGARSTDSGRRPGG